MSNQQINNGTGNFVATDDVSRDGVTEKVQIVTIGQVSGGSSLTEAPVDPTYGLGIDTKRARYPWEQRNPKWIQIWYDSDSGNASNNPNSGSAGPVSGPSNGGKPGAGPVSVFSYTLPSGRSGLLQSALLFWLRETAATSPGNIFLEIGLINTTTFRDQTGNITNSGMDFIPAINRRSVDNAVGQQENRQWMGAIYLPSGTTIFVNQYDTSTGGSCTYKAQMQLVEFDA